MGRKRWGGKQVKSGTCGLIVENVPLIVRRLEADFTNWWNAVEVGSAEWGAQRRPRRKLMDAQSEDVEREWFGGGR